MSHATRQNIERTMCRIRRIILWNKVQEEKGRAHLVIVLLLETEHCLRVSLLLYWAAEHLCFVFIMPGKIGVIDDALSNAMSAVVAVS
jgi:hypothetical protein